MSRGISIIYISCRIEPKFEWFWSSLMLQVNENNGYPIEVIVVALPDANIMSAEQVAEINKTFRLKIVNPLPSPVQGAHRLTETDWFSATNARNTGFIHARYDYVAVVDDLTVLIPGWLDAVVRGANENYCVLGTYEKRNNMVVENGVLTQSTVIEGGHDSRLLQANKRLTIAPAGWFFGCSFAIPMETVLQLNGFDHICDCIGTEDSQFGVRLKRTDTAMFFDKRMGTIESAELHFVARNYFKRGAFPCSKERYFEILDRYGIAEMPERNENTYDAAWFIQDLLKYLPNVKSSMLNPYDLRTLRNKILQGHEITVADVNMPDSFWWDNTPFKDM